MLDLSLMKGRRVYPNRNRVRAEPGVTWGELDRETQTFGLATTGGIVSITGNAGFTLGGGIGWLVRKNGLMLDGLMSAAIATPRSSSTSLARGLIQREPETHRLEQG